MAGFALAASVAVVAYLGVGMISVDEQGSVPPLASNEPLVVMPATPATMTQPMMPLSGIQTVQGQRWNAATPAVESKLNTYLYDHNTMSSVTVMNSRMLPSIRFVESRPLQGE